MLASAPSLVKWERVSIALVSFTRYKILQPLIAPRAKKVTQRQIALGRVCSRAHAVPANRTVIKRPNVPIACSPVSTAKKTAMRRW